MGILSVYHPDINEFLEAKASNTERLKHFNLSVIVDDKFMYAVENNEDILLHWPIYDNQGNLLSEDKWDPIFTKPVNAKELWDKIMRLAYDNGEPGIFFQDNMQKLNPAYYVENIIGSNPCAEYLAGTLRKINPQDYGGACNLGSVFLHNFVKNPFTKEAELNRTELFRTIRTAVRFLDDIIDINKFPSPIYENYQKNMRTIGLGYTGLADMLAMLGMKYNSKEAVDYVRDLMNKCTNEAYKASLALAQEKGMFNFCDPKAHADSLFCKKTIDDNIRDNIKEYGIRNAKINSVAPCGTISMAFGNNCSSGIEPIFSLSYDRKVKIGGQEEEDATIVKMMDYAYWLYNKLESEGKHLDYKKEDIFVTALEMTVDEHVEMLSAIANNTDMSVSKTINVPTNYSFEDTKNIYLKCWQKGIKGCTIFRPNPIRSGILFAEEQSSNGQNNEPQLSTPDTISTKPTLSRGDIIECSSDLVGKKRKILSGCGSLHVLAFFDPATGEMQEVYLNKGSTGGCANTLTGLSRTISLLCRAGVSVFDIKDQLDSTGACPSYAIRSATKHDTSKGSCCPMAVGNALVDMWKEMQDDLGLNEIDVDIEETQPLAQEPVPVIQETYEEKCPECGEPLQHIGGCDSCPACGYSHCG